MMFSPTSHSGYDGNELPPNEFFGKPNVWCSNMNGMALGDDTAATIGVNEESSPASVAKAFKALCLQ